MTNSDELERQRFEEWFVGPGAKVNDYKHIFSRLGERYSNGTVQATWVGWQARAKQESNHD